MKSALVRIKNLSRRGKILFGVGVFIVVLLIAAGITVLVAPDLVAELTSAMYGSTGVVHFYPSPACVALNQKIPLFLKGQELGDPTRHYWSSDESKVDTSTSDIYDMGLLEGKLRSVTGKVAGATEHVYIGGAAHIVKDGEVHVTVRNSYADCWGFYTGTGGGITSAGARGSYNTGANDFTFVFLSDPQGANKAVSSGTITNHDFNKAFASYMKNTEKPAFIVVGGDLANLGDSAYMWIDDVLGQWTATEIAQYPIYSVVGNHDLTRNGVIPIAELGNYRGESQDNWQDHVWQDHYFSKGGKVWPQNAGAEYKNLAYSFRYGNTMFIMADTFYMWGGLGQDLDVQTYSLGNMMWAGVDLRQLAFIDNEGKWAQDNGLSHAFVFGHTHLFINYTSNIPATRESAPFRAGLQQIMSRPVFDAYFDGHGGDLDVTTNTVPPTSNVVYQASAQQSNGQYLQDTGKNTYFSVHVSGKHVTITPVSWIKGNNTWERGTPMASWDN